MTEYLDAIYEAILEFLPLIAVAVIGLLLFVVIVIPQLIRLEKRIELSIRNHRWMPRWLYKEQETLLSLSPLVELFAPYEQHLQDVQAGSKRPVKPARFSSWERATRTAYKAHRQPRTAFFDATSQVRAVARAVQLRQLTDQEAKIIPDYNEREHYAVIFNYAGLDAKDIEKLYPKIKSQLKLEALTELKRTPTSIILRADKTEVDDILTAYKNTGAWFRENPAKNPMCLPLATAQDGTVWSMKPLIHTLICGTSGAGKGSVLQGVLAQTLPFWQKGEIKYFGIDPKNNDLKAFGETSIFEEYTSDPEGAITVINNVHQIMETRIKGNGIDWNNKNLKRDFTPTADNPIILLVIDEFVSLFNDFKQMGTAGKKPIAKLTQILAKGRSLGVFLICATQDPTKEAIGNMRDNFLSVILLRSLSPYLNDLFLGEGAREAGYDALAIPSGKKWAGIGYVKSELGEPLKVRFTYSTDQDIIELTEPYRRERPISLDSLLENDSDLYSLI